MEAVGGGDQAQQEEQDTSGQRDPDQGAAGTWEARGDVAWSCALSSAPGIILPHQLSRMKDGVGRGEKQGRPSGGVEDMAITLAYPLGDALHPEGFAGNLAMSHDDLVRGVLSGRGMQHGCRTDAAPTGAAHPRDTKA